jgi:hypothetical protein
MDLSISYIVTSSHSFCCFSILITNNMIRPYWNYPFFCTSLLIAKHCAVALSDNSLHQRTVTYGEGRGGGAESGVALGTMSWPPVLMDNKFYIPSTRACVLMSWIITFQSNELCSMFICIQVDLVFRSNWCHQVRRNHDQFS